ncbi:MAG: hypothetical protein EB127_00960 [Alphaproteobacteria bacterium]|nr:hypothetical protein [Alphaproteobacteria bacterium]
MIDRISEITEFNDISEFMKDEDLDKALDLMVKLIMKPDVPAGKAPELIVLLQSLSAKFSMLARYYTTFEKGGESAKKKNVYYTASDSIDKLVDAIKYSAKFGV